MATLLSSLLPDLLGRVEEGNPPVFWNLQGEVYVQMVYAMCEAILLTGVVQANDVAVTIAANETYFNIQGVQNGYGSGGYGGGPYGGGLVPQGLLAPIRMRAPFPVRKTTLKALDDNYPGWQQEAPSDTIKAWFPVGVNLLGIYPQLKDPMNVTMDFISSPVNEYRPYTGNETVPFQPEFNDLITKFAAVMLRSKEGGVDAEEADTTLKEFTDTLKNLSLFQKRIDSLVFTRAYGTKMNVSPRTNVG